VPTWIWIVIVAVVVLVALFVVGLVLARRRRISLTEVERGTIGTDPAGEKQFPPKGGYKAGGSISFSSGSGGTGSGTALQDRPPAPEPTEIGTSAAVEPVARGGGHPAVIEPPAPPDEHAEPAEPAPEPRSTEQQAPVHPWPGIESAAATATSTAPAAPTMQTSTATSATPTMQTSTATSATPTMQTSTATSATPTMQTSTATSATPTMQTSTATSTAPSTESPATAAGEQIAPTDGRLNRLRGRLARSQNAFGRSMLGLLGAGTMDEDSWTDVEDTLLLADLGAQASTEIAEKLRAEVAAHGIGDPPQARALLRRVLVEAVDPTMERSVRALPHHGRPSVVLVVGVNGTGKTTTTGKLARVLVADGRTVVLGAADTFRAAAADQLATWAERAGATVVRAASGTDPASVAFDAVKAGIRAGADAVLIDTAGRLHTKTGLMDELGKVKRVVEKQAEVDEVLLVLDATTGQNGLVQARVFAEVVDITGIVLTKLDGTAKGGIVVAVQRALGVPVKLVGLGEGPDDLAPFEAEAFVDALLGD